MKTLAIIPACEGSVIFPNKNIRIVNGKPLIYYVINNAIKSKYIDDIVVTSNSKEIINIARQMGVKTRLRPDDLCNTNVSLDTVVNDVFNVVEKNNYDIVVTMQSIAPTLKVKTLDDALEKFVNNNYDSVISVRANKKFYWERKDGCYFPLQSKRCNRNMLEPVYVETGAFLITKTCFINDTSRLGNNIYLYELDDAEAVDVYCFGDLKQVENILCQKKVAIYVNGNNSIGLGHIYRVIQLADELFSKPDIYFDYNQTNINAFGKTTHNLIAVDGIQGLFNCIKNIKYDIFINDILSTDTDYMFKLKQLMPMAKIINFEDEGSGAKLADKVFNALYENAREDNVCAGEKYFIASKLFLLTEPIGIEDSVSKVFICFGGADPQNYTSRILEIISTSQYADYDFTVVIGSANKNADKLLQYNSFDHIKVLFNVDNMAELMSKCDIAVTSRGRTGFELAFLGIPTISIAQNARETLHQFLRLENGIDYLGLKPNDDVIKSSLDKLLTSSKEFRANLQKRMLARDLRNGRKNVMSIIRNL